MTCDLGLTSSSVQRGQNYCEPGGFLLCGSPLLHLLDYQLKPDRPGVQTPWGLLFKIVGGLWLTLPHLSFPPGV